MHGMRTCETILRYPDYYKSFSCSGSQCTGTCCAGWEISVDPETLRAYLAMPGEIGERLSKSLDRKTGRFHLREGRCPFLNRENLCDLILEKGEDVLCRTCRLYPRHMEVYGPLPGAESFPVLPGGRKADSVRERKRADADKEDTVKSYCRK